MSGGCDWPSDHAQEAKFQFRTFWSAVIHHRFGFPSTSRTVWLFLRWVATAGVSLSSHAGAAHA